ncbi:MAG: hypothetical protein FWC13_05330 [Oscillospiraceae bacterium]|nr:hypothetical protein [Oscillospiraceae bacterium]
MFNDGILTIYEKVQAKGAGGKSIDVLKKPGKRAYYGEASFKISEYYESKQSETEIMKKVQIPQDKSIGNNHVAIVDKVQYQVGFVHSTVHKGVEVTYITLERVTSQYDIT